MRQLSDAAARRQPHCGGAGIPVEHLEANEQNVQRVQALGIDRVPTLIVYRDGEEIARCTGYQPEEILELWLDAKTEE